MSNYKQQVIDFFNSRTNYDTEGEKQPREAKKLLASVEVQSQQAILDIATGTGLLAIPVAKKIASTSSVIGVDFSPGMLSQAKKKIAAVGINNLELIEGDVESIEFQPEQFDIIFCCSSIVYLVDIPRIIDRCYGWLKPGGCLAFTTPYKTAYMAEIHVRLCRELFNIDLPHITRPLWTPEKCRWQLQQAGFENIEIEIDRTRRLRSNNDYYTTSWHGQGFFPRGNPLLNLTEAEKQLLLIKYQKAIADYITDEGVWQDSTTLYVRA
ncbi:MAG: class I SAM-dependent methyltransferase, partial [Waterburya sp.]